MSKIIEIKDLNVTTKDLNIIEDFSVDIEKGEFIGLKGPSGSGKSTILKYMAQLLNPSLDVSGEYKYQNKDILEYDPTEIRKQITYCFQNPSLFGETVRDNLEFPFNIRNKEFEKDRALDYLQGVDLDNNYLDKDISTLSGGEKQRVSLVRNLMIEPKVILLDEISGALDKDTREIVWDWIKEYKKDTNLAVLMVTHLDEEYEMTDRVIELKRTEDLDKKEDSDKREESE